MCEETIVFYKKWLNDVRVRQMLAFKQHRFVSTYRHCVNVTNLSVYLATQLHMSDAKIRNIIIGALLHDYFLYDYHVTTKHTEYGIHAWSHPRVALENAMSEFDLNKIQKNIIRSHMWPVTFLHIPTSKEAWIVMLSDKICATLELINTKPDYQVAKNVIRKSLCKTG